MKVVTFSVAGQEYGVDIDRVLEVIRLTEVTAIPDVPYWIQGIMDLRGQVIPVISLRRKLGLDEAQPQPQGQGKALNRVLIARRPGRSFGLVVDNVNAVIWVPPQEITAVDSLLRQANYLAGIARIDRRLVPMLDLDAMLSDGEAGQIAMLGEAVLAEGVTTNESMGLNEEANV